VKARDYSDAVAGRQYKGKADADVSDMVLEVESAQDVVQ